MARRASRLSCISRSQRAVFLISGIAETARSPFDLLEAESEIVAGFHVEYSGMKFALFFLGEYVNALAVSIIFSTLFLGGYAGPGPAVLGPSVAVGQGCGGLHAVHVAARHACPRVRVDQMHDMNWKFFVPISIVNLLVIMILVQIVCPQPEPISPHNGSVLWLDAWRASRYYVWSPMSPLG